MSKRHIPESHTAHPNVTPLIDIIMCLIIFFMLMTKIGVTTGAEAIVIPTTLLGTTIQDMGNTLTLNIPGPLDDQNPIVSAFIPAHDGKPGSLTPLPIRDSTNGQDVLLNTLKHYKEQNAEFKVILRAKADLPWRYIAPVLDDCTQAGIRSINFNTKQGDAVAAPAAG